MAAWSRINLIPFILTRTCSNANQQLFEVRVRAFSLYSASRSQPPLADSRDVEIGVTRDGETIVCFHPSPVISYELTKPIPSSDPSLDSAETHDLVLKSHLGKDNLKDKKTPAVEELAKMFYTTKHRWYPVGEYHARRRNRHPPKDR